MDKEELERVKKSRFDKPKFKQIGSILPKSGSILDYGCNAGTFCRWIKEQGDYQVFGTDIEDSAIDLGREIGEGIHYFYLNELRGEYDIMTIMEVVEHVSNSEEYFQKLIDNHLKDGGHLVITTPREVFPQGQHVQPYNCDRLFNFLWYYIGADKITFKYANTDNTMIAHCKVNRKKRIL